MFTVALFTIAKIRKRLMDDKNVLYTPTHTNAHTHVYAQPELR